MIVEGKDVRSAVREDVDVCIVGSGAGGATVARELSVRGLSVVVLEEGGAYSRKDFTGRIKEAFTDLYRNQGVDTTAGVPAVIVPTGKCLGGTTVINMGTCFRTPDNVLTSWQEMGLEGYGPKGMAPYFDRVEEEMSVQAVKPEVMGRNGELIAEGAKKLGLSAKPIRRNVSDACKGCGNCAYGCTEDAKQSMILNAIPEADRRGVKFYCDARAIELVHDKEKITGVHGHVLDRETGAFRHNVDIAAKVVVLSAGALNTPALLLKNGVCNRSGQVGRNLKLHLCMRTIGIFDEVVDAQYGVCQNLYIDDYLDQGIMLEATFTGPGSQVPGLVGMGKELWELCREYRHMASLGIMISESSSGRVRADDDASPAMTFHVNHEDAETLFKAMIISDRILFSAGARKVINGNFAIPEVNTMAELDTLSRDKTKASDFILLAAHPQCTARMGVNPKKSVVGPDGQCHDLKNLYVADASVFPTSLGVNPQETIWAMAARISESIAKDAFPDRS
jgi:choline dehydrogenase-like flavoprotein